MRIIVRSREPGSLELGMVYGAMVVLALVAARTISLTELLPSCAFRGSFGIPCPTCGSTRSLMHLARGDFLVALGFNPLFCVVLIAVMVWSAFVVVSCLARFPRISLELTGTEGIVLRLVLIVIIALNWLYLLRAD